MNTAFSPGRLVALIIKGGIQMRRDRITFAMMLGVPLLQLILFGFAINNDPKHLPAALVTTSQDHYTRAMVATMEITGYYRFDHIVPSAAQAEALIEADAADPAVASGAISTLSTVASQALLREQSAEAQTARQAANALEVVVHRLYNPEGITQYNIVPGLLGVILHMPTGFYPR